MSILHYTVRYSNKAKYLQLRISTRGLEVVIPANRSFTPIFIEEFIQQKKSWIDKNWHPQSLQPEYLKASSQPPTTIYLQAIAQTWQVIYLSTDHSRLSLVSNACREIKLMGNTADNLCLRALRKWLIKMGRQYLIEELNLISKEVSLPFRGATIRNNVTRWGSCSSKQKISLCCKLLFLPPLLVRHVLLHELCHTKIMHHGKSFRKLLQQYDKSATIHAKELKTATRYVPSWLGT